MCVRRHQQRRRAKEGGWPGGTLSVFLNAGLLYFSLSCFAFEGRGLWEPVTAAVASGCRKYAYLSDLSAKRASQLGVYFQFPLFSSVPPSLSPLVYFFFLLLLPSPQDKCRAGSWLPAAHVTCAPIHGEAEPRGILEN